jgi:aldehyde dehydrogenase (NAD+)
LIRSCSPQTPDDLVAEAAALDAAAVADAAAAAREAQREWWSLGASGRSAALTAAALDLRTRRADAVALVVREVGKPVGEAGGEVARAIAILEYYAQAAYAPLGRTFPPSLATGLLYTERRPHGLAGLITPWNFPLAIPLWKAAPALTTGNAVLLKPSPEALGCAMFLSELLGRHLPAGLFAVVPGGAETGEAVADQADVVSFTGSVAVGRAVAARAAERGVPVQCEMGGQNAAVVLPDADPGSTAAMIAGAAMGYAGQKCTATRRVVVVGENLAFVDALTEAVAALRPGDPGSDGVAVGPVISRAARERVVEAVGSVRQSGGRVLTGGSVPGTEGWYVEPTLVDGLPAGHPVLQEETFGPLAAVQQVASLDEALALVNGVRFGLVASVHGRDVDALLEAASRVDTGMVKVNAPTAGVDFYAPFGGEKESSHGPREQGAAALDFYTSSRTISFAAHGGTA